MAKTAMKIKQQRKLNSLQENTIVAEFVAVHTIFKKIRNLQNLLP